MNNSLANANRWPLTAEVYPDTQAYNDHWDPGFDAERCIVLAKFGPYRKLYPRPAKFTKRFYHTLYALPIEHWQINDQVSLYDGFCTIDLELTIHFQATFDYAIKNEVEFDFVNTNIKTAYDDLVRNIVETKLLGLNDANWVQTGLDNIARDIALAINELLMMQDIQAISHCSLSPRFKTFPDVKFKEEAAYLLVLKKCFEVNSQKQQEQFVQEQILEHQRQEQERMRLENLKAEHELALLKQAQEAEHQKKLLLEQEKQQRERFEIEQRIHAERVKQETALNELSLTGKFQIQEKQELFERQLEEKTIDEKIAHQLKIKEKELTAKVKLYEVEKSSWSKVKDQSQINEIKQKQRQKQLQINAEIENKAYLYRQHLLLDEQMRREKLREETPSAFNDSNKPAE